MKQFRGRRIGQPENRTALDQKQGKTSGRCIAAAQTLTTRIVPAQTRLRLNSRRDARSALEWNSGEKNKMKRWWAYPAAPKKNASRHKPRDQTKCIQITKLVVFIRRLNEEGYAE
ncbi:MAG TPA: hypothetical protein VFM24_06305 [Nitrospira sp.]|nr:hypothetical protein [Nitrospira sp.]